MKTTPYIDAWRQRVSRQLTGYGRKAELARHLASMYGGEERVWQNSLQKSLKQHIPSGEVLMAIDAWLSRQT